MNKRYMDFVPAKVTKSESLPAKKVAVDSEKAVRPIPKVQPSKPTIDKKTVRPQYFVRKAENGAELGVIEDLGEAEKKKGVLSVEETVGKTKQDASKTFEVPKSPFINQNKVEKRPLSKNVYQKEVIVPKEEPKGPVTIISKPEKDAHVSLVVAVILTIIVGAAAGTVAFLLLPK
jgi:hypothetical protein